MISGLDNRNVILLLVGGEALWLFSYLYYQNIRIFDCLLSAFYILRKFQLRFLSTEVGQTVLYLLGIMNYDHLEFDKLLRV